jgi:hypothetical protein
MPTKKRRGVVRARRLGRWLLRIGLTAAVAAQSAWAQDAGGAADSQAASAVTVRGTVFNSSNGQPVRRALVKIDSVPERGAVTDETGRFEISGVPAGVLEFSIAKPGFKDFLGTQPSDEPRIHRVRVGSGMPELSFTLAPDASISGHVTLSDDLPAQGIGLILLHRTINDGLEAWEIGEQHQTTPDGSFRFSGVRAGTYVLLTEPAFQNVDAAEPRCNAAAPAQIPGFAAQFYSDARQLDGADRIDVAAGQAAEANLALRLTTLHLIQVTVTGAPAGDEQNFSQSLLDASGRALDYPIHAEKEHTLCAYLPDGDYTLAVSAIAGESDEPESAGNTAGGKHANPQPRIGQLNFRVEGQAARNLRMSLAEQTATPVLLHYDPAPPPPLKPDEPIRDRFRGRRNEPFTVSGTRVGNANNIWFGIAQSFQTGENAFELQALPGAYEMHATSNRQGVCLGAVTSGGQDLARTPWIAGPSGTGDPIEVQLRTDCANLTVQMPPDLPEPELGEAAVLYVYVVPAFSSVGPVSQARLVQFGDRTAAFTGLTPGPYRVFAFRHPREIALRDANAVDRLGPGQPLVLEPGANATLTVEESPR